jgi:hypothetical protein
LSLSASPLFWCFFFFRDRVSGAGGVAEVVRISLASVRPWVQTPVPPKKKKIDKIFANYLPRLTSQSSWFLPPE